MQAAQQQEPQISWEPQAGPQERLITCPVYDVLYGGQRGGGKTDGLLGDFTFHASDHGAAAKGILFRKTMPEFEEIIARSKEIYRPIGAEFKEQKTTWIFPNGATLKLRYLKKESDAENYQGHSYTWLGIDEMGNFATPVYIDMLRATLRSGQGVPVFFRATCNPGGVGHNWIKQRYIDPVTPGRPFFAKDIRDYRVFIPSKVSDNRILMDQDPGYVNRIRSAAQAKGEYLVRAWLDGDWDIVAGGMFDDVWSRDIHVLPSFPLELIPIQWKLDRSFDWGSSKPFSVGWWAESNGEPFEYNGTVYGTVPGDVIRIYEWYGCRSGRPNEGINMQAYEIGVGIKDKEEIMGIQNRVKAGPADTNIFDDYEPSKSYAGDMERAGIRWEKADKGPGSRKQGWSQIRKYLSNARPPDEGFREHPGLFVLEWCTDFIRTVPTLPRCDKDLDDVNTDAEDHAGDEVRYRLRKRNRTVKQGDF